MDGVRHSLAVKFAVWLNQYLKRDNIEYLKIVYGAEVFITNITKLTIVLIVALLLNIVLPMLAVLLGFNFLRRNAFGLHALSSVGCLFSSIVMMILIPLFCKGVWINNIHVLMIFIAIFAIMWFYAPADTEARPLVSSKTRSLLKKKAVISSGLLCVIVLLIPGYHYKFLITLGALYETVMVLPITYKLMNRDYANYKKYHSPKDA